MNELPVFPFADRFSYLSDDELLELAQSIETDGMLHTIVIYDGQLLDGRNRLKALAKTNLTDVEVKEFSGTHSEAVFFVLASNVRRRHLETWEKAKLANDPEVMTAAQEKAKAAQGTRTDLVENIPQDLAESEPEKPKKPKKAKEANEARAIAIEAVGGGISRETARKAEKIQLATDKGAAERIAKLDSKEWSIEKAYNDYQAAMKDQDTKLSFIELDRHRPFLKRYESKELTLEEAYAEAQKADAAAARKRAAENPEALILIEQFSERSVERLREFNLKIGKQMKTTELIDKALDSISTIEREIETTKKALVLQYDSLVEEMEGE